MSFGFSPIVSRSVRNASSDSLDRAIKLSIISSQSDSPIRSRILSLINFLSFAFSDLFCADFFCISLASADVGVRRLSCQAMIKPPIVLRPCYLSRKGGPQDAKTDQQKTPWGTMRKTMNKDSEKEAVL